MLEDLNEQKSACRYIDTLQTPSSCSSKSTVLTLSGSDRFQPPKGKVEIAITYQLPDFCAFLSGFAFPSQPCFQPAAGCAIPTLSAS